MGSELLTSWGDYQLAIERILASAENQLYLYDPDLAQLKLESPEHHELLRRLLQTGKSDCLRIAVRNPVLLRDRSPRLIGLLRTYAHQFSALQIADTLAHLRDCMILADGRHALVRFDQEQPRCKLLIDEPDEVRVYLRRFEEIWQEGGTPISATVIGL